MTRNAAGKRELQEQFSQAGLVQADLRVDLAVGAFEVSIRHHRRPAVSGAGYIDHVEVVLVDDPIEVRVDEILSRCRAPVSKQHAFDVAWNERALEQRIVEQEDLAYR